MIDAAVREIVSAGIVVVAAAGNDGKDADGKFIYFLMRVWAISMTSCFVHRHVTRRGARRHHRRQHRMRPGLNAELMRQLR